MNHFDYLKVHVPDLDTRRILDLGSGRGKFLFYCLDRGVRAVGLEYNPAYIAITQAKAKERNVEVEVHQGRGESLPFTDATFDFMNISEVIEHVESPTQVIKEVHRVLSANGSAYLSVPNRYGWKDPHFHLYVVNWIPRSWSFGFISLWGKHKDYSDPSSGLQRLDQMHYYTFRDITNLLHSLGFTVTDQRESRIKKSIPQPFTLLALWCYYPLRFAYFDSFHLLIEKTTHRVGGVE